MYWMNQDWLKNQENYITALEKPAILFFLLPPFTFEMPFLVARGQGRGWKAGSAGGEDPMKVRFPSAEGGGTGRAICAPPGRFRPDR
jgi:hypothetical protein